MPVVEHHSALANPVLDPAQGYFIQSCLETAHLETDCAVPDSSSLDMHFLWDSALTKQIVQHFKKQNYRKNRKPNTTGR